MTTDAGAPGAPRFDVVLRGYDRRQVDEHLTRLQRALSRLRADLDVARSQQAQPAASPASGVPAAGQPGPPGGRPRPTPRPRPGLPSPPDAESPDMIGSFTDRMQSILQAAEEEAAEIRNKARNAAATETESVRADLALLIRQRDGVLAELTRMRGQLEGLLAAPTARITLPAHESATPSGAGEPAASQPGPGRPAASPGAGTPASPQRPDPARAPAPSVSRSTPPSTGAVGQRPSPGRGSPPKPDAAAPAAPEPEGAPIGAAAKPASEKPHPRPGPAGPAAPKAATPRSPAQQPAAKPPRPKPAATSSTPSRAATGSDGPASAPAPSGDVAEKQPAHRLPSGAYPAVGQKESMRPRTDPDPEPGDLFRPASERGEARSEETSVVPAVRTTSESRPSPGKPGGTGGAEATVQVGAVRPAPSEATVLTPAVKAKAKRPAPEEKPDESAPAGGRSGSGGNGTGTAKRPSSPSRSG